MNTLRDKLKLRGYTSKEAEEYAKVWQMLYAQFENANLDEALEIIQTAGYYETKNEVFTIIKISLV